MVRHTSDYASWVVHGDAMERDVLGDNAACTNNGVMADTTAGQEEHTSAHPNAVFDNKRCRRQNHVIPLKVVLVIIQDERVMT
jgi:hypothetical protein